ncbi:MAG: hypothetical protein GX066_00480 [Clostridiaceae bacterium]|nr:hypothetical protein [Clostridiaceae bacterium]
MATSSIQGQEIQEIIENNFTLPSKRNTGTLGKEDFLNLLVTQLKYQDPLKPMEDKEFIAQMAQFSSLEQMQNLNATFNNMKAFNMIGKEILATIEDENTGTVKYVAGVVESVKMQKGKTYVVVDGKDVLLEDISEVLNASSPPSDRITDFAGMIGRKVTGLFIDPESFELMEIVGEAGALRIINDSVYTVINNVSVKIYDVVLDGEEKANFTDLKAFLDEKMEKGEEIIAVLTGKDPNGKDVQVKVKGTVKSFEMDEEGRYASAVMDGIKIPARNVYMLE